MNFFNSEISKKNSKNGNLTSKISKRRVLGLGAFIIGGAFILIGISKGEVPVVFAKASIVCLECIGIG